MSPIEISGQLSVGPYQGYHGVATWDEESKMFHGEVIGISDVITFAATSCDELKTAFQESIADYLEYCRELNRQPQ